MFDYRPAVYVESFRYDDDRRIYALVARPPDSRESIELPIETLALAAGTVASTRVFLESIYRQEGLLPRLTGLMDNRQVLVPFLNLGRIGTSLDEASYQYHQVCLGLPGDEPAGYVHGLLTTLTTALVHPVLQRIPLDLPTALFVFRHVRSALGIVNLNLHDTRRLSNGVQLEVGQRGITLRITSAPPPDEPSRLRQAIRRVRKALLRMGCIIPPGGVHVRPIGSSVHYAGTLPMSVQPLPFTTSARCRSHDFRNLYVIDGSTFPFLPAKNLTFTLMANAVRVAEEAFQ